VLDPKKTGLFTLQSPNIPDPPGPDGDLVATLIGNSVTDIDPTNPKGIAITKLSLGAGAWQYQLSGTPDWNMIPGVTAANPFLLKANDRVRFNALPDFIGTRSISFKAWDQSAGTAGTTMAVAGSNAFSKAIGSSMLTIGTLNNRPILNPKLVNPFTHVQTNATDPPGNTVASLLGNAVVDLDAANGQGIALTSAATKLGTWQYSTDGGNTWNPVGVVSTKSVLLLRAQDMLRLVPNTGVIGIAKLSYYAWDQTSGTLGPSNVLSALGTAVSKLKATSAVTINTAPELDA
jgi:hypothetical protein